MIAIDATVTVKMLPQCHSPMCQSGCWPEANPSRKISARAATTPPAIAHGGGTGRFSFTQASVERGTASLPEDTRKR